MNDYSDIINYNYLGPKNHPRMDMRNRAAQFGSFRALSGYEDELKETRRIVEDEIYVDEDQKEIINRTILELKNNLFKDKIKITYFVKDLKKNGGFLKTIISSIKKIDEFNKELVLINNTKIKINSIVNLEKIDNV